MAGMNFLDDMELERQLGDMSDRELNEFTAHQVYQVCNLAQSNERRIVNLEKRSNKFIGLVGTIGAFLGALIVGGLDFLFRR